MPILLRMDLIYYMIKHNQALSALCMYVEDIVTEGSR